MLSKLVLPIASRWFDLLEKYWEQHHTHEMISRLLVYAFIAGLIIAELAGRHLLPFDHNIHNHFFAVELAFTLLLLTELLALIFVMPNSVGVSVGKQLEILSLILIRSAFKEFSHFEEPVIWNNLDGPVLKMVADAFGSLSIFVVIGVYYKTQKRIRLTESEEEHQQFKDFKKFVALLLLIVFIIIGLFDTWAFFEKGSYLSSFNTFYTVLIFSDILIVLIAMRYTLEYPKIFRYSAFVLTTVLIRISLTAPPYLNAALGIVASLFLLAMTFAFNYFLKESTRSNPIKAGS
ncbi:MAG: hypothetical protein KTR30_34330 [Saprospiraceae bacterium]|nr:hypothetical protein [Saprospiraceae bacterium]